MQSEGMGKQPKGVITVFLTLILTLVLSLILAMVESAVYGAARMKTEMIMGMGMDSLFAEYNRELLKRYDLYFIDSSYGSASPALSNTEEHFRSYMVYNCSPGKGSLLGAGDLVGMKLLESHITEASYATDHTGRVFKRQAIQAIKDIKGISALEALAGRARDNYNEYRDTGYEEENMDARQEEILARLEDIDYKIPENPAADVFDEQPGILDYLTETDAVSRKHIDVGRLASHRSLQKGCGMKEVREDPDSFMNELFFDEYLVEKCSDFTQNDGHNAISYELEYILQGQNTDIANLKKVVKKLLLIRYAADATFIMTSSTKKETVETVAEVIGVILGIPPEAMDAIADLILLAWAYGECVSDVKRLMAGERVPLKKTDPDWRMPLWGLLTLKTSARPTGERGSGFSYVDYIRVFLLMMDKSTKVMRAMDVIEANLRTTEGNHSFRMDGCIEYLDAWAVFSAKGKYEFNIKRSQSYLAPAGT